MQEVNEVFLVAAAPIRWFGNFPTDFFLQWKLIEFSDSLDRVRREEWKIASNIADASGSSTSLNAISSSLNDAN